MFQLIPESRKKLRVADETGCCSYEIEVELRIGETRERFVSTIGYWSEPDYFAHWLAELRNVCGGHETSFLLQSIGAPFPLRGLVFAWVMYREGEMVFFQEMLLNIDNDEMSSLDEIRELIPERRTMNEDGEKISEWCLPISAVRDFLMRDVRLVEAI